MRKTLDSLLNTGWVSDTWGVETASNEISSEIWCTREVLL
jgi:hypothetical protein